MKSNYVLAGATLLAVASAHPGGFNGPKILGSGEFLSEMRVRSPVAGPAPPLDLRERTVEERQTSNGRCGRNLGTCTNCCSIEGYCGTGIDYCSAPDCQYQYGPQCDANKVPSGPTTANVPRPFLGSVLYGGNGIYPCTVPGTVAFTFDDGPYIYTSTLLDKLKAYNAKATFFITGNNLGKGAIDSTPVYSNMIKRMVAEGHQIASHTWSHQDLSTLDAATFNKQMVYNEMAFNNILGYFPTYMRPPYSSCDATCASRLRTLGYHITYFDLDTEGYLHTEPSTIQISKNIWDNAIRNANPATTEFLNIEHDIHDQVVNNLTDHILASMYSKGFRSVTVGECLNDPKGNWYRAGPGGTTPSSSSTTTSVPSTTTTTSRTSSSTGPSSIPVSTDGRCSASSTCVGSPFGNCCSQYGWCGTTAGHCGTGCNPLYGICGTGNPSSSSTTTTTTLRPPSSSSSTTTTSRVVTTTTTTRTSTSSSSPSATPSQRITPDATCGGPNGYTCRGSQWGNCCSQYGWCGSTAGYCGTGCQAGFGNCT